MKYDFTISDNIKITQTTETYYKKSGCKNFPKKPDKIEVETIASDDYNRFLNAKCVGDRYYYAYTFAGYMPIKCVGSKTLVKIINKFEFKKIK